MSHRTRLSYYRRFAPLLIVFAVLACAVRAQVVSEPAPGVLLVAADRMADPRFARSVVLLIEHDRSGSWGLIINKPTDIYPDDVLPAVARSSDHSSVYFGGPVQVERLVGLYQADAGPDEAGAGLPGVHWSDSEATLTRRLQQQPGHVRVFAGYAGWGPGQLGFEIARGGWRMIQGRKENVFNDQPDHLWERLNGVLEGVAI